MSVTTVRFLTLRADCLKYWFCGNWEAASFRCEFGPLACGGDAQLGAQGRSELRRFWSFSVTRAAAGLEDSRRHGPFCLKCVVATVTDTAKCHHPAALNAAPRILFDRVPFSVAGLFERLHRNGHVSALVELFLLRVPS